MATKKPSSTSPLLLFGQETERLLFRKLEEADFDSWLRFCNDPSSLQYTLPAEHPEPEAQCRIWMDKVFYRYAHGLGGMNALVEKQTGAFVGQCGLLVQTVDGKEELEIGYSLMPEYRGKGFATEAARQCRDFAFGNKLTQSLISIIHVDNAASAKVAKNVGMTWEKETYYHMPVNIFRISSADL